MSVLVYVENTDGTFKKSAFEVVSYANEIAKLSGTTLTAISIGDVNETNLAELGRFGAKKILNVSNDKLKTFVNQAYASVISEAAKSENSTIVIIANTFTGRGLAPRVAVKLEAGLADGAIELPKISGDNLTVKKAAFSGKAFANVELTSKVKVITLNTNSFKVIESAADGGIENYEPSVKDTDFKIIVGEIVRAANKVSLPDAELVVSAGRGLKGPENWGMIEELADLLGAATACSKPVSDSDWRPHSEHVGQTGIAISPNLYIAIGISGAIQHLAGVSSSKVIVVINKDPEAPFFKVADYGIVGDAFEVVPKLIAAVKSLKASN